MDKNKARALLKKYREGRCNKEEVVLLESWLNTYDSDAHVPLTESEWAEDVFGIFAKLDQETRKPEKIYRMWMKVAAVLLIGLSLGIYLDLKLFRSQSSRHIIAEQKIQPGTNRAFLTLANGHKVN